MYKHYTWNIFATSTVVTFLASIFVFSQTPVYRATATVVASSKQIQADILYLRSADLIRQIIDDGGIDFSRQSPEGVTQGFGLLSWTQGQAERLYGTRRSRQDKRNLTQGMETIVSRIRENLTIAKGEESMWIDISFDSPDQQLAANVANLVARIYLGLRKPENIERTLSLSRELQLAEKKLLNYLSKNPGAASSAQYLLSSESELEKLQNELTLQRLKIGERTLLLKRLKQKQIENPELVIQDAAMIQDSDLRKARQKKEELAIRRKEMTTRYGVQHLKMIALNAEITEADDLVKQQIRNLLTRLEYQLEAMIRVEQSLVIRILDQKNKQRLLHKLNMRTKALQLDVDTARRNFEVGHPSDTAGEIEFRYSSAAVPINPVKPRITLILISVFLITCALMGGLLYWRKQVSDSEP